MYHQARVEHFDFAAIKATAELAKSLGRDAPLITTVRGAGLCDQGGLDAECQRNAGALSGAAEIRLALVQAAIVVVTFALVGYLTQVSLQQISQASIRTHIEGEGRSLDDEFYKKGAGHLPLTVAKRSRLWRGFDYRLVSPAGVLVAGACPPLATFSVGATCCHIRRRRAHHFLIFTKSMPDGSRLTVGRDTAVEAGEMAAIQRTLLVCGALGVIFCVAPSCGLSSRF